MKLEIMIQSPIDPEEIADLVTAIAGQIREGYEVGYGDQSVWTLTYDEEVAAAADYYAERAADGVLAQQELEDYESGGVPPSWEGEIL